jgi:hypothetical protein
MESMSQISMGITEKVIDPITHENVLSATFVRDGGSFTIRCKSVLFHKYFKTQSITGDEGIDGDKWNRLLRRTPVTSFTYHRDGITSNEYSALRQWGVNNNILFLHDDITGEYTVPNISWIRSRELDVGIKIVMYTAPMDDKKFNDYCDRTMKLLSLMYKKYMTKKQSKGKITTKLESLQ